MKKFLLVTQYDPSAPRQGIEQLCDDKDSEAYINSRIKEVGMDRETARRIFNGENENPTALNIAKTATILGCPVGFLFTHKLVSAQATDSQS